MVAGGTQAGVAGGMEKENVPMSQERDEVVQVANIPFDHIFDMIAMSFNAHQLEEL
jgi:hypothetical protein